MTGEKNTTEMSAEGAARIEDIYRATIRIEEAVKGIAGDGKRPSGTDAAGPEGAAGALEGLMAVLAQIRSLQNETVRALGALSAEVGKILADRSNGFIGRLGPDGRR